MLNIKTKGLSFSICALCLFWILCFDISHYAYAQQSSGSVIINGDTVEYSMEGKEATATGNIVVNYKGAILTCDKLSLNTETKEGAAEGNAKLQDERGVITGSKIIYNFNTKTGVILDAGFCSNPYFGKAQKLEKVSDKEFITYNVRMSTCNYDHPHYLLKSGKIDYFPYDKMQAHGTAFLIGGIPVLYLPQYRHNLKPGAAESMNVQLSPGNSKDWGYYGLSAWRYKINNNLIARLYLDYREKLGIAQGIGLNYSTSILGRGDIKFYYTDERPKEHPFGERDRFERYFLRWRHQWDIDPRTGIISEYYKIGDQKRKLSGSIADFLKDYFYREYEKDSLPLSYALFHHNFNYSTLAILFQKRTNHWYDQLEKTPQVRYSLPSLRIGNTPLYWENNTYFVNLDKKATTAPVTTDDVTISRLDMANKISLPIKALFIYLTPFVENRQTFYDKGVGSVSLPVRTTFYSGAELSAKFYRTFNIESNFLGMGIKGLRHVITPTVEYAYNHEPTISSDRLKQIDEVDSISRSETITLGLSNKLQTKRGGTSVNLVDFRLSTIYNLKPQGAGSSLSDFLIDLEFRPCPWFTVRSDAIYGYKEEYFREANVDLSASFGQDRSFSIGNRYLRNGGKEMTSQLIWRFNPKWKFKIYERYQFAKSEDQGLKEQEYTLSRDLHCWEMDVSYNLKKNDGHTVWLVFRLKAFPELEFGFEQSYHGSQSGSND